MEQKTLLFNLSLFLFLLFSTKTQAQEVRNYNFSQIDAYTAKVPEKSTRNIEQLGTYLSKKAKNDVEKVRAFYYWLTHEIAYDVKTADNTSLSTVYTVKDINQHRLNIAKKTLSKRKAVCQGYSELFRQLCKQAEIPVYVINGYSKQEYRNNTVRERPAHAWNAVQIDGKWYLLDVTWGAGIRNSSGAFVPNPTDKWFLTEPSTFVLTHLPLDPSWQLLDCPINLETFKKDGAQISKQIQSKPACYDYEQKLAEISSLPQREQELQSAINAYEADKENIYIKDYTAMKYMNVANRMGQKLANNYRDYPFDQLIKSYERIIDLYQNAAQLSDQKSIAENILRTRINYANDLSNKIYYADNLSIDSTGFFRHKLLKLCEQLYKDEPKNTTIVEMLGDAHFNYAVALETKLVEHVKTPTANHHQKILIHLKEAKKYFKKGRSAQVSERIRSCDRFIRVQENMIKRF